jgi:hypothetical protein
MEPKEFPVSRRAVVRIRNFKAYAIDSGAWQKAEIAKWWPTIKAANVKVDQPRTRTCVARTSGLSAVAQRAKAEATSGFPHIAEPVITGRAQLHSSPGAHSRDPVAHAGYGIPDRVKRTRQSKTWSRF